MTRDEIILCAEKFTETFLGNYISAEVAIAPEYVGMQLYDPPIFAFGSADDDLYIKYKSPNIIGGHFLAPSEWLPTAKTVISFFVPYTEQIKSANAQDDHWPANEWLHGRYEGQLFLKELSTYIQNMLLDAGYVSTVPALDPRYGVDGVTSNWSERHVAFACGLGTFGLSKGIITKRGMCGRLGSVLTEWNLPTDTRPYRDTYEYCTMCGACVLRCPVQAISQTEGKAQLPCSDFLDKVREKNSPRYGCGKCQVNVPCESEIPVSPCVS
ncbi:MAG: 4Fe-4S binding protein [Oscillospiraceae bacterium]|nr:4Fe-4S binding protein [Oscillospiraceae bacterium]